MKRALIVANTRAKIVVKESWIEFETVYEKQCVGFMQIKALYINKGVQMSISDAYYLSEHFPVYFIDGYRNIVGKIVRWCG